MEKVQKKGSKILSCSHDMAITLHICKQMAGNGQVADICVSAMFPQQGKYPEVANVFQYTRSRNVASYTQDWSSSYSTTQQTFKKNICFFNRTYFTQIWLKVWAQFYFLRKCEFVHKVITV
jgi:hypothetical protein